MLIRKVFIFGLMTAYLYTLAFTIFMTDRLKVPATVLIFPLLLYRHVPVKAFAYWKETILILVALLLYNIVGMGDVRAFTAGVATAGGCAVYFNYFVGNSRKRLHASVIIFAGLLFFSMLILVGDHYYQDAIDPIRSRLLDDQVKQSPSGIAPTQFAFGYQVVAFTTFIFVASISYRLNILFRLMCLAICLLLLFFGMNRSAFVCFVATSAMFILIAFRLKGFLLLTVVALIMGSVYQDIANTPPLNKNNILSKNQAKEADEFKRSELAAENLKIMEDYPWGLIFYGKTWEEVVYRNPAFPSGLSSHNAYLMFITYVGPFLGIGILLMLYSLVLKTGIQLTAAPLKYDPMLIALFGAFLALSLNAMSHTAWLLNADGPSIFFFFALIHTIKFQQSLPEQSRRSLEASPIIN